MVRSPELGTRTEAEALGHAWLSRSIDVSAQARLGLGGDRTAPASLDAARLDLSARLAEPLWLTGSLRYVGLFIANPVAPALFPNPARHADLATASWDVTRRVVVRLTGGYAKDLTTGLERGYAGPEVALPRLLGRYGSIAAGWLEERGWAAGRSLWVQGETDALLGARLLLRGSFYMDRLPAPLSDARTVGARLLPERAARPSPPGSASGSRPWAGSTRAARGEAPAALSAWPGWRLYLQRDAGPLAGRGVTRRRWGELSRFITSFPPLACEADRLAASGSEVKGSARRAPPPQPSAARRLSAAGEAAQTSSRAAPARSAYKGTCSSTPSPPAGERAGVRGQPPDAGEVVLPAPHTQRGVNAWLTQSCANRAHASTGPRNRSLRCSPRSPPAANLAAELPAQGRRRNRASGAARRLPGGHKYPCYQGGARSLEVSMRLCRRRGTSPRPTYAPK